MNIYLIILKRNAFNLLKDYGEIINILKENNIEIMLLKEIKRKS